MYESNWRPVQSDEELGALPAAAASTAVFNVITTQPVH
jgi:hypothetical protein